MTTVSAPTPAALGNSAALFAALYGARQDLTQKKSALALALADHASATTPADKAAKQIIVDGLRTQVEEAHAALKDAQRNETVTLTNALKDNLQSGKGSLFRNKDDALRIIRMWDGMYENPGKDYELEGSPERNIEKDKISYTVKRKEKITPAGGTAAALSLSITLEPQKITLSGDMTNDDIERALACAMMAWGKVAINTDNDDLALRFYTIAQLRKRKAGLGARLNITTNRNLSRGQIKKAIDDGNHLFKQLRQAKMPSIIARSAPTPPALPAGAAIAPPPGAGTTQTPTP